MSVHSAPQNFFKPNQTRTSYWAPHSYSKICRGQAKFVSAGPTLLLAFPIATSPPQSGDLDKTNSSRIGPSRAQPKRPRELRHTRTSERSPGFVAAASQEVVAGAPQEARIARSTRANHEREPIRTGAPWSCKFIVEIPVRILLADVKDSHASPAASTASCFFSPGPASRRLRVGVRRGRTIRIDG